MVSPFVGEAIPTAEITVVADMNTKRLDFGAFHRIRLDFILIQKPLRFERVDVRENFLELGVGEIGDIHFFALLVFEIVSGMLVAFVQRAAAYVVDLIFIAIIKNVNHCFIQKEMVADKLRWSRSAPFALSGLPTNNYLRSIFSSRDTLSQDWLPTVQLVLQAD